MLGNKEPERPADIKEEDILSFLNERKERSFTSEEIMGGLRINVDFSNTEISRMSTYAIADFTALLYDLVRRDKVEMKFVDGRMYFLRNRARRKRLKCPKCGANVAALKRSHRTPRQITQRELVRELNKIMSPKI